MNDLQGRGKALEDLFFGNRDHQLLDQLRKEIEGKEAQAALAATSGISDSNALAKLTDVGVTPESLQLFQSSLWSSLAGVTGSWMILKRKRS